jgi:hypothetical protein
VLGERGREANQRPGPLGRRNADPGGRFVDSQVAGSNGAASSRSRGRSAWSAKLFGNPGWNDGTWLAENAVMLAVACPIVISAVFAPLAVRAYRRLGG